jgi:hypothetical protein
MTIAALAVLAVLAVAAIDLALRPAPPMTTPRHRNTGGRGAPGRTPCYPPVPEVAFPGRTHTTHGGAR